ncbi:MAG: anhydro-N-acetylmuramic acid kinase [Neptuniibacter sp.]
MSTPEKIYIGLMSGTSLDSIDAVAATFSPDFKLIGTHTEIIPDSLKGKVRQLMLPGENEIDLLGEVDIEFGQLLATAVNNLIQAHHLKKHQIQAIGSHGQTIRHRPESGFTIQIGDPNIIAEKTRIITIADFRRRDMAAGGQGAPLVPAFHKAMFSHPDAERILLNIGGMANITFLPKDQDSKLIGFDTGPGNILLNAWIEKHHGHDYDQDGRWAANGTINTPLLEALLDQEYFQSPPPKSTGRELFNLPWLENILSNFPEISPVDIQSTLTALTVTSIKDCLNKYVPSSNYELYVCGGGSHNSYLTHQLRAALPSIKISTSEMLGIEADWMEACAFAWLAKQCLDGNSGNIKEATGAQGERILGAIYQA